jgi:hypothetical protein
MALVTGGALLTTMVAMPARAGSGGVARHLQRTMDQLNFEEVLDLAPPGSTQARALGAGVDKEAAANRGLPHAAADPQPIVQQPQVDATVLELDRHGRPVSSGTVLMSPQYPRGVVVPVDRNFHTEQVRWRQWDDAGWYANRGQGSIDVVPGRENAPIDFMQPYPASVLKVMVGFGVLRLVDSGEIALDDTYDYRPTSDSSVSLCGTASSNTIRNYLEASLTFSDNASSCALVKLLWDHNAVEGLNQTFQDLGLETLQLKNTNPATGGRWSNPVTMTSLDTAKLLALINGAPGTVWTTPAGRPVTSAVLSPSARSFVKGMLAEQGHNDMLSTANWCGRDYPAPGIPQVVPQRWIAADGTVTVAGERFGQDVRPCNLTAQVTFAHKTGWVSNSGADAGIVESLPGRPRRNYIIVVFSNLGTQYVDPDRPADPPGVLPIRFTQKFAQLGLAIDRYEQR